MKRRKGAGVSQTSDFVKFPNARADDPNTFGRGVLQSHFNPFRPLVCCPFTRSHLHPFTSSPLHACTLSPLHRFTVLVCTLFLFINCGESEPGNPKVPAGARSSGGLHCAIQTDKGTIEVELFEKDAPKAVENFRLLAEHGYYDGLTFHRIVKGFMIQGGDPSGDGTGGESAWGGTFADEIDRNSAIYRRGYRRGILAMANSGPNTNGSQFFIMHQDYSLPPNYVIFGNVIQGMEVVDALVETPTTTGMDGAKSKPLTPPEIRKVTIKP